MPSLMNNTTILIHECSFDQDDRNIETKKHTTLLGFAECWRACNHKPLFTFLTHFSGRRRIDPSTGQKTLRTDAMLVRRLMNEYKDLRSMLLATSKT